MPAESPEVPGGSFKRPGKERAISSDTKKSPGQNLVLFLSSGAWLGHLPLAPGTFGTLMGIPLYLALSRLPWWGYIVSSVLLIGGAIWTADRAQSFYGGHDDRRIVIDEVVGYIVTMTGITPGLFSVALGFAVFRLFDIFKPWPCRTIDRLWLSGAGVVMDDVVAGLYGLMVLHLISWRWPVL